MDRISAWLCPTEQHRVRVREAGARVRIARTIAAAACGVALIAIVPFQGWWTLILYGTAALTLGTLEMRLRRSERPELIAAQGMLVILALIAVGVAFSGGEESPALPWLILPVATAAARFRPLVVVVGAGITAALMVGLSVGVDAQGVVDDPRQLISAVTLLVGITAITTALTEGELEHRERAVLDPLTGLLNRSSLESRAVEIEHQARLTGGPVSLVLLDLDRFKRVNDTHGHERGDAVLRDVAYQIRKSLRSFELVYRMGGEEFLVLLPGVALPEAVEVAERVRHAVRDARPGDFDMTDLGRCGRSSGRSHALRAALQGRRPRPARGQARWPRPRGGCRRSGASLPSRRQDIVSGRCRRHASPIRSWTPSPAWWPPAPLRVPPCSGSSMPSTTHRCPRRSWRSGSAWTRSARTRCSPPS